MSACSWNMRSFCKDFVNAPRYHWWLIRKGLLWKPDVGNWGDLSVDSLLVYLCKNKNCMMLGICKKLRITMYFFLSQFFFFFHCKSNTLDERKGGRKSGCWYSVPPPPLHSVLCGCSPYSWPGAPSRVPQWCTIRRFPVCMSAFHRQVSQFSL